MASFSTVLCCPEFIIKAELVTFTISLTLDMDAREVQKSWFASQVNCTDVFRTSIFDTCTNRQESISWSLKSLPTKLSFTSSWILKVGHLNTLQLQSKESCKIDDWPDPFTTLYKPITWHDTFINDQNWKRHHEKGWRHKPRRMDSHWRSSWSTGPLNIKKVWPVFTLQQEPLFNPLQQS